MVPSGFEGGLSITRGILGWGGLKIETFLGPEMATSVASAISGHFSARKFRTRGQPITEGERG
jgi:hypothetical protein